LESADLSGFRKTDKDGKFISDCENQIRQCVEQRQRYYEQFIQSEIDSDVFNKLKEECTAQLDRLNNRLTLYKQGERDKQANEKAAALAAEALSDTATPQDIVNALVDKVIVFPNNSLEIRWKFVNFAVGV
jgi:arylamine N-acetyltransferase